MVGAYSTELFKVASMTDPFKITTDIYFQRVKNLGNIWKYGG